MNRVAYRPLLSWFNLVNLDIDLSVSLLWRTTFGVDGGGTSLLELGCSLSWLVAVRNPPKILDFLKPLPSATLISKLVVVHNDSSKMATIFGVRHVEKSLLDLRLWLPWLETEQFKVGRSWSFGVSIMGY